MKGRPLKAKKTTKSVKISQKKRFQNKIIDKPIPQYLSIPLKTISEPVESFIPSKKSETIKPYETPCKGFRPFDTNTPVPLIYSRQHTSERMKYASTPTLNENCEEIINTENSANNFNPEL